MRILNDYIVIVINRLRCAPENISIRLQLPNILHLGLFIFLAGETVKSQEDLLMRVEVVLVRVGCNAAVGVG